ncbi:MAG: hypothetical protein JKY22_05835, partial [Flavobacteriaceae bacterium]|nr:hypothetical protein [Flavobacteriaceae bacterium]
MSNSFEFGEIFGLESPLTINATNTENIGFYEDKIDFQTLVEDIKASKAKHLLKSFDYKKYLSTLTSITATKDRETLETHSVTSFVDVSFKVEDKDGLERNLRLYGTLNKKIENVRTDIYVARTTIDAKKHRLLYKILFVYEGFGNKKNNTDKADIHRVAIAISTVTYEDYSAAFDYLGYHRGQVEQEVIEKFDAAFILAEKSPSQLSFLYRVAPVFVLQNRSEALKWRDLEFLLEGRLPENREKAVLKIIRSLTIGFSIADDSIETIKASSKSRINNFFYKISLKRMGGSLFEKLYLKINDFGIGEENYTLFIQELYLLWLLSDYSDPKYVKNLKEYTGGPEVILYDTKKILGFYNNDYNFDFVGDKFKLKIKVTREDTTYVKSSTHSNRPRSKTTIVAIGTYNLFHPITLADVPKEGEIKIPTNVIPAFYLKAFDDKQRWSNIDKGVWLGVDIGTTFLGVGNLVKLRYLKHLSKLQKYFKLSIGVAELSSSTLGIIFDMISNHCEDKELCDQIREVLFWIEIASLGTDALSNKILRKKADDFLDSAEAKVLDKRIIYEIEKVSSRKKVRVKNTEELGAVGNKITFNLLDELGESIGALIRTVSDKGRTVGYTLEVAGKKIKLNSKVSLLNRNMGLSLELPVGHKESILYADFAIPTEITEVLSGFGNIMLDDAVLLYKNSKKLGKVDGNSGIWMKNDELYQGYGGQSVNLKKFWEAREAGKSIQEAAFETFTGKWAKNNG